MEFVEVLLITIVIIIALLVAFWIWQRGVTARETRYDISVTGQRGGEAKNVTSIGTLRSRQEETGNRVAKKIKVVGQDGGKADTVDAIGETDPESLQNGMVWKEEYDTPLSVVLCDEKNSETQKLFHDKQVYNMQKHPKGLVLIVNNYKFEDGSTREGTNVDASNLNVLFTYLGFRVIRKDDLTAQKIKDELLDRVKDCHDGSYNCFVGIILSHGRQGGVVGTDRGFVKTKEIMDMFHGDQCPGLLEKPKLFFIQACQGSYVSYRNRSTGSVFITALVQVFCKLAVKYDLNQLMTRVNNEIESSRSKKKYVQVSKFESTLSKFLYFFPGMPRSS